MQEETTRQRTDANESQSCGFCGEEDTLIQPDTLETGSDLHPNSMDAGSHSYSAEPYPEPAKPPIGGLIFVFSSLFILIALLIGIVIHLLSAPIKARDLNSINGCPELYGLTFGMTVDQVSDLIKVDHRAYPANIVYPGSTICLDENAGYEMYGLPVDAALCAFNGDELTVVLLSFLPEDASFTEVSTLYEKIYGPPSYVSSSSYSAIWLGEQTTIDVYERTYSSGEKSIVVAYSMTDAG